MLFEVFLSAALTNNYSALDASAKEKDAISVESMETQTIKDEQNVKAASNNQTSEVEQVEKNVDSIENKTEENKVMSEKNTNKLTKKPISDDKIIQGSGDVKKYIKKGIIIMLMKIR